MNVYRTEIKICATAYIRAASVDGARKIAEDNFGDGASVDNINDDISEAQLDSVDLPQFSLSPPMTYMGPLTAPWRFELVEESAPNDEKETAT